MLFMLRVYISKPEGLSNKDFYTVWRKESEAALGAVKAGVIKGIWKIAGGGDRLIVFIHAGVHQHQLVERDRVSRRLAQAVVQRDGLLVLLLLIAGEARA